MTTAADLVARARALGVELTPTPEGEVRIRPISKVPPPLLAALRQHREEIRVLLTSGAPLPAAHEARYRATLRRAFTLAGRGAEPPLAECRQVLDDLAALTDDVGVRRADQIRGEERARWAAETGTCAMCGGPVHS